MISSIKIENGSCDPNNAPFRGGLLFKSQYMIQSTCMRNLMILALAVLELSFRGLKIYKLAPYRTDSRLIITANFSHVTQKLGQKSKIRPR